MRRPKLPLVDLAKEPVSISVVEDPGTGKVSFSDIPEKLIPRLIETFGAEAVDMVLEPSAIQGEFFQTLGVTTRRRPRHRDTFGGGVLEDRVRRLIGEGRSGLAPYFMTAINRTDEAIFGRTGVIYFVCRKGCHFCQYRGFDEEKLDAAGIAARMLALEKAGADNVQWLSPTAFTATLVEATWLADTEGFGLPIIHKSEGEDTVADLELLDGLVDVYLPDVKFVTPEFSRWIGLPATYPKRMEAAIREMYRQVGKLTRKPGRKSLEGGGLLVRHLLMPGGAEEATKVLAFVASIDRGIPVRIMTSYEPLHDAQAIPEISRKISKQEIDFVAQYAHEEELHHVLIG
ncbi:MAG: hypothetical protein HY791_19115 [Deltaproteobacteria bacterium]|nr:hypothetical protein [Deltaproteobacteria bacterium]